MKTLLLITLSLLLSFTHAIREDHAKEQACFDLSDKVVPLDLKWVSSIKYLYYPLVSRLELYRMAADVTGKAYNDISESSLYYDSCIMGMWDLGAESHNGTFIAQGFNRQSRHYHTKPLTPNLEKFTIVPKDGKGGIAGTVYTTYTDNSTYMFSPFCSEDGQMAFALGTTTPNLPKETIYMLKMHAISLGFKKEFITEMRYDACSKTETKEEGNEMTYTEAYNMDMGTTMMMY